MNAAMEIVALIAAIIVVAHAGPWLVFALIAVPRPRPVPVPGKRYRLAVIVPAHNEEARIGRCVRSILAGDGAVDAVVFVVADNCTDRTGAVAAAAGARVLTRHDPGRRGKPFALAHALAHIRDYETPPDGVVIIDGDSYVRPGFLAAMAGALERGGAVVQSHYRPEPGSTGLQRLRTLAFALAHWARPLGASRLGLGTTLKGNGMAFRWDVCRDGLPWSGLAEDAGLAVELASRAIPVRFEPRAVVFGHMAAGYREARTQDLRWESGRGSLRLRALGVGVRALLGGRPASAAGALEVASLPLTRLGVLVAACACASAVGNVPLAVPGAAAGLLTSAVLVGWVAARISPRDLVALLEVPRFALHKLGVEAVLAIGRGPRGWERTSRES